jgi:hypothetical protein
MIAVVQNDDFVGQGHRLGLIMRDIDHRGHAKLACATCAISTRICTRNSASRFDSGSSNRNTLRFAHDGAADCNALTLAARKLLRPAFHQLLDTSESPPRV